MEDVLNRRLRLVALTPSRALRYLVCLAFLGGVWLPAKSLSQRSVRNKGLHIPDVRSGMAELLQKGRSTILSVHPAEGAAEEVALTHTGKYPQGLDAPYAARLIGEVPGKLLIFTDTFSSNPGNKQGECGASPTGERFVHVVSLVPPGRETLSILLDSCLLDIEPERGAPKFDPESRTLILKFKKNQDRPLQAVYRIGPDGSVLP